jgi:hypothetical protein
MGGGLVTDVWVGDAGDPAAGEDSGDVWRASVLVCVTGLVFASIAVGIVGAWVGFGWSAG